MKITLLRVPKPLNKNDKIECKLSKMSAKYEN